MRRGEIWTVAGGGSYSGKPRPAVVLQDDRFDATASITVCGVTSDDTNLPLFRVRIEPTDGNGLQTVSRIMVDKVTTVPKTSVGQRIGRLADEDVVRLNRAVIVFFGLAG